MSEEYYYTPSAALINLVRSIHNGAASGTGIVRVVTFAHELIGPKLPQVLINYAISIQNNLFGGYPTMSDYVPSLVLAVIFGVILLLHSVIFIIDQYRGHHFYISCLWILYSAMKVVGFALRACWSQDITQVNLGLAGEVFLIVPAIIIVSANLILAQRLFTWRHPVGGSRKLFWGFMIVTYIFVLILIAVTILASFVPYLNYISLWSYRSWIATVQFTSIMVIVYSLTAVSLIGLSFWLPTKKDELRYTYQPWWIESFAPFYFPEKGAAQKAAAGFMKRNSNHRHATRVIAATHHHFHNVKGLTNKRGDLKHNVSMGLLIITTILILIGAIGRAIVVFQARQDRYAGGAANKWFMYVCWGIFEVIINVLYIVGRVDLRFYRPDRLPKEVRNIATANQTYYPSSDEEEDGFHRDKPETYGKLRGRAEHGYKVKAFPNNPNAYGGPQIQTEDAYSQSPPPPTKDYKDFDPEGQQSAFEDDEDDYADFDEVASEDWDFTVAKPEKFVSSSSDEPAPTIQDKTQAPYPTSVKDKKARNVDNDDAHSEFTF
ncbi:uncharacterized protein LODBEIA_P36650 [Lodderomyces beijingensis]|uniref:Uncharacterized protein n=1 Tax=Lodderomyces beijingensis TaxID=1775926 RepID=A0ABP0ZQS0_9ASCO